MYRTATFTTLIFPLSLIILLFSLPAFSQGSFDQSLKRKLDSLLKQDNANLSENQKNYLFPNDAMQNITIPSGWGGYGTYIFGGIGGAYPQVYQNNTDLIVSAGVCFGDPFKLINVAVSLNMTNVHRFTDFSGNFIVNRIIPGGNGISAGALQLFASKKESDASGQTYYFAFSHAVQSLHSEIDGSSKLTYTIGIGNGRFYLKSPDDVAAGRGSHGTALFGGISYEIRPHINLIGEWSGVNLGISAGIRPFKNPLSIGFGVVNITRYSSDKPNAVFTIGLPLSIQRKIY